jgi:hypothetical protein
MTWPSYESIIITGVKHDTANMLSEFMWLNQDISLDRAPWIMERKKWGSNVACLKKMMGGTFRLTPEQLAFYIEKAGPHRITGKEFGRMVVMARRLFRRRNIPELRNIYLRRREEFVTSEIEQASYKTTKPKSFLSFVRELERDNG